MMSFQTLMRTMLMNRKLMMEPFLVVMKKLHQEKIIQIIRIL